MTSDQHEPSETAHRPGHVADLWRGLRIGGASNARGRCARSRRQANESATIHARSPVMGLERYCETGLSTQGPIAVTAIPQRLPRGVRALKPLLPRSGRRTSRGHAGGRSSADVGGEPHPAGGVLVDQRLEGQIDADFLVGLHERRAGLRATEYEKLRRPQRHSCRGGSGVVIDAGENGHALGPYLGLERVHRFLRSEGARNSLQSVRRHDTSSSWVRSRYGPGFVGPVLSGSWRSRNPPSAPKGGVRFSAAG